MSRDKRTKEEVLSLGGELIDDGYLKIHPSDIPRVIMHARFLEHHARATVLYGTVAGGFGDKTVSNLLYGAAKEIRDLHSKLEEAKEGQHE